ncbi:MAG: C45 family autoproteolytic acyltransferase/hydrolase [Planctomycetaceae bacterium]
MMKRTRKWMRCVLLLVTCLAATAAGAERRYFQPGTSGTGWLKYVDSVPVMYLEGTPAEIGRQHAELTGRSLHPVVEMPRATVKALGFERAWPLVSATSRVLLNNAPERFVSELEAVIATGGADRDGISVGNALIELRRMGGCSTFVVTPDRSATGELIFGRNFDFPAMQVLDKYSLVVIMRPKGRKAFASVSYPGMIGVISGMNESGLCVATLDVYESGDGSAPRLTRPACRSG